MFAGFDFDPCTAHEHCKAWLEDADDVEIEYVETQRASLDNMLKNMTSMSDEAKESIRKAEQLLFDYLVDRGGVSSPVLRDEALGGDLIDPGFDSSPLGE